MPSAAATTPAILLVLSVAAVGVLHTAVPDHWVPITLVARQRGWSRGETARAALMAGMGHVVTTLIIALAVWFAGAAFATRFGNIVDTVASMALVLFGGWIAIGSWRTIRRGSGHSHSHHGLFSHHGHGHSHHGHSHPGAGGIHGPERQQIQTGSGLAELSIFEDGVPPRFRLTGPAADWVRAETIRENGTRQPFTFAHRDGFWESLDEIPEPHEFRVDLVTGHGSHDHSYQIEFTESAHGAHGHDSGHHHDDGAAGDPLYAPLDGGAAVLTRHAHAHRHNGTVHVHWHDHAADTTHEISPDTDTAPPMHRHKHRTSARTALLLILGSSPMVEGIPAFFSASRYGVALLVLMAAVFAVSTIAAYVVLCVYSTAGLQRIKIGPFERYGEVISGAFIALVGIVFWLWPVI